MWSESREHAGVRACWFEEREKEREICVCDACVWGVVYEQGSSSMGYWDEKDGTNKSFSLS